MNRLLEIGFQHVGRWLLQDNALVLDLPRMAAQRNVLYAFVMDQSVFYVGKTANTLEARMGGYLRPHTSQRTNVRNNQSLVQLLQNGKSIDIYAWADSGLHRFGQFHLNYAAGLEDSIIQVLAPPWNGARSNGAMAANAAPAEGLSMQNDSGAASTVEVQALETGGLLQVAPTFQIKLRVTYFNRGFFNVPVKYAGLFPKHGTEIAIYCGETRTLVRAIVDRHANRPRDTPRIYGKKPLIAWFNHHRQLNDNITIRVITPNEIELQ